MPFEGQLVGCHSRNNSLSTTACTPVGTYAIVQALLDRVDVYTRQTRFTTWLTLWPARRSAETFTRLCLCGVILKYTTITFFYSMSQSQSSGWVKQKHDNNCKTTRIVIKFCSIIFSLAGLCPTRQVNILTGLAHWPSLTDCLNSCNQQWAIQQLQVYRFIMKSLRGERLVSLSAANIPNLSSVVMAKLVTGEHCNC